MIRREMCFKSAILRGFIFNLFSLAYCSVIYNITSFTPLLPGQNLNSPNQTFELGFFTPNNSHFHYVGIWFKEVFPQTVVWVANRENPITDSSASLIIGGDGNLCLLDGQKKNVIWSTNVSNPSKDSIGLLSDEGVFTLTNSETGDILWDCYQENPTDVILPGKWLVFNETDGYIGSLNSWKSENDPSPGDFTANMLPQTPPILIVWKGSKPYWRGGPWDKIKFIGIPELSTDIESGLHTGAGIESGTGFFDVQILRDCDYNMFKITSTGIFSILCWTKQRGWYSKWGAPASPCEVYGACGPFGVCQRYDPNLTCRCLEGFMPRSNEEWMKGNWSGGCVRQSELNCGRNASTINKQGGKPDIFLKIGGLMLPDSYVPLNELNQNECYQQCVSNCSCSGYAFVRGIGCLVWGGSLVDMRELPFGGQDLFLRLAHSELDDGDRNTKVKIIAIVVIILSAAILAAAIYVFWKWKAKIEVMINYKVDISRDKSQESLWSLAGNSDAAELPSFDFNSILVATNNFSTENKLGQGGYGPVYKGKLLDRKDVAIKRLSSTSGQGLQEFKSEVMLISKLKHRNLVRLIGCCIEREERILIYEYMPNKSLDNYLFNSARKAVLDWKKRMNIILGVAQGLLYLHRDSCLRVIHRDLKVSNILLDENMNPKISDFGLSKIFEGTEEIGSTRRVVGTIGYMAPEYLLGGIFSEKSDVFGFGVLILEIFSGRRVNSFQDDNQYMSLVAYAWHCWRESNGLDMVDRALGKSFSRSKVRRCINIGLLCVQDNAADRPTMAAIVSMLSGEAVKLPQPKQPAFAFQNVSTNSTLSVNYLSESVMEPR